MSNIEINIELKKLYKIDTTTKQKAAEELNRILQECSDSNQLHEYATSYFAAYNYLSQHHDRRVRELIYTPLHAILNNDTVTDKHDIVDAIFINWYLHLFDTSNEVKRAANELYNKTFTSLQQRIDILIKHHESYFNRLRELLRNHDVDSETEASSDNNDDSNNDSKSSTPTQSREQSETNNTATDEESNDTRLTVCGILSLAAFISTMDNTSTDKFSRTYEQLLFSIDDGVIQHLINSTHSSIRKSTCTLIQTLINKLPSLVLTHSTTITPLVMQSISDTERNNQLIVWQTLITYTKHQPDAWQYIINSDNTFVVSLLQCITTSGYGVGNSLYQMYLPLIASIPLNVAQQDTSDGTTQSTNLYYKILDSIWQSKSIRKKANSDVVQSQNIDYTPLYTAYFECIQWICITYRSQQPSITQYILYNILLPLLLDQLKYNASDPSFFTLCGSAITRIDYRLNDADPILRLQLWQQITDMSTATFATNPRHVLTLYKSIIYQYQSVQKSKSIEQPSLLLSCNSVFIAGYRTFVRTGNNDALQICVELANTVGITTLLQYSVDGSDKPVQFTQSYLIPSIVRLSTVSANSSNSVIKLITLSLNDMQSNDKQQCIEAIIQLIQPKRRASVSTVLSVTHSILLKHMNTSNALYDDVVLEHAEIFLQATINDDDDMLQQYAEFYTALVHQPHMLSHGVLTTIISSFYDVIGYWIELNGNWSDQLIDIHSVAQQFMTHTGASTDCIPYVLSVLTSVVDSNAAQMNQLAAEDHELQQLQANIISAILWLTNSTHTKLSQQAKQSINIINKTYVTQTNVLNDITNKLTTVFTTSSIATLSDVSFQDKYVASVYQLLQLTDNQAADNILTQLLPTHDTIVQLLLQNTVDSVSRLLCIHDSILALSNMLTPAVLFDLNDTSYTPVRAQLVIDLMAVHYHTTYYINITHYNDTTINAAALFIQAWKAVHLDLSIDFLAQCVKQSIESSSSTGWMYSRVMSDILKLADYHAIEYKSQLQNIVFKPLSTPAAFMPMLTTPLQHTIHGLSGVPASDWLCDSNGVFNKSISTIITNIQNGLPILLLDDNTKLTSAGMLSVLATIMSSTASSDVGIIDAPQWLLSDHTYLLNRCDLSDDILHTCNDDVAAFLRARIRLVDATLQLSGELDDNIESNSHTLMHILNWSTAAILYAVHTHAPSHNKQTPMFSRDLMYLEPTITIIHRYQQQIQSSTESAQSTQLFQALVQLLLSNVLDVLNVQRYDAMLSNLGSILISFSSTPTAASYIAQLLASQSSNNTSSAISILIRLLSHPHSAIALSSQQLLSYGIFYQAARAKLTSYDSSQILSTHDDAVADMSDTQIVQYRANKQRDTQIKQLYQFLPVEFVDVLDSKFAVQYSQGDSIQFIRTSTRRKANTLSTNHTTTSLFTSQPIALQLRAHMLVWCTWLQILEHSLVVERDSNDTSYSSAVDMATNQETLILTYDKKVLMLSHIRDNDIEQAVIDELIEHVLVGNTDNDLYNLNLTNITPSMLKPTSAITDTHPTALTKRLNSLHKQYGYIESIDDTIYYGQLSAYLYMNTLRQIPAITRIWWQSVDRGSINDLNRITSTYFTPLLIYNEINRLDSFHPDDDEFTIKCNYDSSIVRAVYSHSEINIQLTMSFPANYPLLPISVQLDDKLNVKDGTTKKWQLNIAQILASQDSTILDAIKVWKSNIEKHFAGVEECVICYNIVSTQNHQLPQVECQQCHNKFHSACIYKWFNSSGKSNCPMCRNVF